MTEHITRYIRLFTTGFTMGLADLIPGVSGGTIAFLSGIYEELLQSIKVVSGKVLKLLVQGRIKEAIAAVPLRFLLPLGMGILTAIFSLAQLLSWLLETYPVFVWSFFFGLVLASTLIVLKRVVQWDMSDKVAFVISAIAAYMIVGMVPVETPTNLLFIFASGAIAICAMILPGISGSFILLLLGKYQHILAAASDRDVVTLGVFAVGCAVGLSLFARALSWLFMHHHDISVAVLAGLMLGSIRKIWPWKQVLETRVGSHGELVPVVEKNILPNSFTPEVFWALVLAVLGIAAVYYLDKLRLTKEHTQDIEDPQFTNEYEQSLEKEKH